MRRRHHTKVAYPRDGHGGGVEVLEEYVLQLHYAVEELGHVVAPVEREDAERSEEEGHERDVPHEREERGVGGVEEQQHRVRHDHLSQGLQSILPNRDAAI